jgi:long-subunit fatty acid transport protein
MKRLTTRLLILNLFIIVSVFSQNNDDAIRITDNQIGFGARALGMGGAYMAISEDYSAVYWNPAGLAQMRKMEIWLGISHVHFGNDIKFPNYSNNTIQNYTTSTASINATKLNSFGIALPVPTYRGSLVFAIGYQKVKDFESANEFKGISDQGTDRLSFEGENPNEVLNFWGQDVQKEGFNTDEGSLNQWSFAGAVDVSPSISAGLSLNFWTGSSEYFQEFLQTDIQNNFDTFPADFDEYFEQRTIFSDYSAFNAKFSSLVKFGKFARLALAMDLPHSYTVEEEYFLDSKLQFDNGDQEEFEESDEENSGIFKYKVKMPFRFSGGAALALGTINVSGSAEYGDWSQVKYDSDDRKLTNLNKNFKTDYRGTWKLRLGGEIGIPSLASQFRAGMVYDQNPLKNLAFENDRKYVSAGYGILVDHVFKIDLSYLVGFWEQTTFDDLTPEGTDEDILYQKFLLTVSFRY